MEDLFHAYRLFRLGDYIKCKQICEKYPKNNALQILLIRCRTNMSFDPMYLTLDQDMDIIDNSVQKSLSLSDNKTATRLKSGLRTAKTAARQSITRQAMTARIATSRARQTATRMKTAIKEHRINDKDNDILLEKFPEIMFDFFLHDQMDYMKALDLVQQKQSTWWNIQRVKALYFHGDYKNAMDSLTGLEGESEYHELMIALCLRLNLAMPELPETSKDLLILQAQMKPDQCTRDLYLNIVKLDKSNFDGLFGLANSHLWTCPEISLILLSRIHQIYGYSHNVSAMMGLAAFNTGLLNIVCGCFKRILSEDDASGEALAALGWIFLTLGDLNSAYKCLTLAKIDSDNIDIVNNLAVLEATMNENIPKAIEMLTRAASSATDQVVSQTLDLNVFYCGLESHDLKACHSVYRKLPQKLQNEYGFLSLF